MTDFEPTSPPTNIHPTIYMVNLGKNESATWEANAAWRAEKTAEWKKAARARGKKTVQVHGRYCQLAEFSSEETC